MGFNFVEFLLLRRPKADTRELRLSTHCNHSEFPKADVQRLSSGRICEMLINEPRNVWRKLDDEVMLAAVQHMQAAMGK